MRILHLLDTPDQKGRDSDTDDMAVKSNRVNEIMITREDALLLLDKFCEAQHIRCNVITPSLELWAEGKLRRDRDVLFLQAPGFSLELRLIGDISFEYAEPEKITDAKPQDGTVSGLGIALPLRQTISLAGDSFSSRDKVFLLELEN